MFSRIPRAGLSTFAFFLLATVAGRGVDIISQDKFYGGNGSVALPSPQVAIQGNGNLITSGDTGTQAKGRYEMRDHVAIPGLHPFRLHDRHTTGTRTLALEWSPPLSPALRSGTTAVSGATRQKQFHLAAVPQWHQAA